MKSSRPLAKRIEEEINRETLDAMRERKMRIDHAIIKGTKLLGEGNLLEAQRQFRSAVDDYVDEKGLFPLLASRFIDAGHFKASLEYVKRAIEEAPDNSRAYDFLMAGGKGRRMAECGKRSSPTPAAGTATIRCCSNAWPGSRCCR